MWVVTSWDDGHPADLRIAELLDRHGLQGTFFVPVSNHEGRPVMTAAELRSLDGRFEVASHTADHRYLRGRAFDDISQSVQTGKEGLEQHLGHRVGGFAYPGGAYDRYCIQAVRSLDLDYARTVENLVFSQPRDRWRVPTSLQCFPHRGATYLRNWLRYPGRVRKLPFAVRAWRQSDLLRRVRALAQTVAADSGAVFHLWGHGWEIEQLDLWGTFDKILAILTAYSEGSLTVMDLISRRKG